MSKCYFPLVGGDEPLPQAISVQSSYKLSLPPHLIIPSSCIKLVESIGQGIKSCVGAVYFRIVIMSRNSIPHCNVILDNDRLDAYCMVCWTVLRV